MSLGSISRIISGLKGLRVEPELIKLIDFFSR
jgi:hypothetical protein